MLMWDAAVSRNAISTGLLGMVMYLWGLGCPTGSSSHINSLILSVPFHMAQSPKYIQKSCLPGFECDLSFSVRSAFCGEINKVRLLCTGWGDEQGYRHELVYPRARNLFTFRSMLRPSFCPLSDEGHKTDCDFFFGVATWIGYRGH